jgi:hypothetical protein
MASNVPRSVIITRTGLQGIVHLAVDVYLHFVFVALGRTLPSWWMT